ncbi:hypothetical protein ACFUJU_04215 [Streptomyces sp. NPDC057235]|uniref:hypothetical protein n=1 Tax=Streptomyces sp. NPDC057235 TaxID=3346058 RepID=UPI003641CB4A
MPNELNSTSIHTRYAEQLAADLAGNRAEQASIAARLEQLQAEEKWLITTLDSVPGPIAPASGVTEPAKAVQEAAVPQPRETWEAAPARKPAARKPAARKAAAGKAPAKKAPAAKRTAAKRTAAKTAKAPAEKPAAGKTAAGKTAAGKTTAKKATAGRAAEKKPSGSLSEAQSAPTLGTLLDGLLDGFPGEPLKVSEIHAEFAKAHPERSTSVQVVRNALEGLVKKDRIEKDTRQGVALYTKPGATDAADAGAGAPVSPAEPAEPVEAVAAGV